MSVTDWSPQPGGNALADRAIPARDGMAGREVPEAIRGLMAKAAALALDQGGALVSSGFDNVYEVATNSGISALKPGVSISFWADRDNTAEPYLNVDGSGPRRWLSADGLALPAGAVQGGLLYTVAWNAALPGTLPAWRMVGAAAGSASTGLTGFDFSGALTDRAQYDAQPKGKVFLAIADTPLGPTWTLYVKRSNGFGDWSTGLPIKASPSQSTAEAQAAAERANERAAVATEKADTATSGASTAVAAAATSTDRAAVAVAGAATATDRAAVATDRAAVATDRAAVATQGAATAVANATLAAQKADAAEAARAIAATAATATTIDRAQTTANRTAVENAAAAVAIAETGAISAAANARAAAAQIGIQVFDFSFDSEASPTDDWSN